MGTGCLLPEIEIGHQLIGTVGGIPAKTEIAAFLHRNGKLRFNGLTAIAPHLTGTFFG